MAKSEANIYLSQDIDQSLKLERPTARTAIVVASSVGLGVIGLTLDNAYRAGSAVRNFSREYKLRERIVGGIKGLGEQALSALGPISRPEDGVFLGDSSTYMGYVVQEVPVPPQAQQDSGEVV